MHPNDVSLLDYQEKLRRKYLDFVDSLEKTPPVPCPFSVGDTVTFTNEFGVVFEGRKVIGFSEDTKFYGRFIHLDSDKQYGAYWFPHRPDELQLEPTAKQIGDLEWV